MVAVVLSQVQQHHDEEVEDQDGAGIDDDLNGCEEFRVEGDIEPRDVKKHDQQRQRTVDRIARRDNEHRCSGDHECKIEKEYLFHHTSSSVPLAGCRSTVRGACPTWLGTRAIEVKRGRFSWVFAAGA